MKEKHKSGEKDRQDAEWLKSRLIRADPPHPSKPSSPSQGTRPSSLAPVMASEITKMLDDVFNESPSGKNAPIMTKDEIVGMLRGILDDPPEDYIVVSKHLLQTLTEALEAMSAKERDTSAR